MTTRSLLLVGLAASFVAVVYGSLVLRDLMDGR